jgi:hypothetical protein
MARVHVLKELRSGHPGNSQLCLQWCRYEHNNNNMQYGYRFIWRAENDSLQAARGQARIPSIAEGKSLMDRALTAGWGDRDGDAMQTAAVELQKRGCVVHLATGYVGWPNKEAAIKGPMTPQMIEWEQIIREWS